MLDTDTRDIHVARQGDKILTGLYGSIADLCHVLIGSFLFWCVPCSHDMAQFVSGQ